MPELAAGQRLPEDVDAQPPVRAAAALRSVIRGYRDEIDREQRLPKALVEQFHAAGFYSMVIPREMGGLQVDPLTYVRAVELLAEAAGSVGWNLANNSIAQLVTLGLPDEGVREIYAHGPDRSSIANSEAGGMHHVIEVLEVLLRGAERNVTEAAIHVAHVVEQNAPNVVANQREPDFNGVEK